MKWYHALLVSTLVAVLALSACGAPRELPTPTPTRMMKPTFTPTPASSQAVASAPQSTVAVVVPTDTPTPTPIPPTPTFTATPTWTPTPKPAVVVRSRRLNVRAGPSTLHPRIGMVTKGERLDVLGKTPDGTWWQIRLNDGTLGWVYAKLVQPEGPINEVQVAQNIPTPPPTPTPTYTPTPRPTPTPSYTYNKKVLYGCEPNAGITEVHGTVYFNHTPHNGARVVFSNKPDGQWITQPVITGPHTGYSDWSDGFYSHILGWNQARGGEWYFWIVDGSGRRISVIAHVHTDSVAGPGKCQKWTLDWDTN